MGLDYALVHLKYTIPPAVALTLLYRPFLSRIDLYKILFLISIAVLSTIPWDSYLIRRSIWTYPPSVIIGPTLFSIPAEELFFFVIQTYNTTLLYLILSKPLLHSSYLITSNKIPRIQWSIGHSFLSICVVGGFGLIVQGNEGTYLGLILAWAGPFALMLWTLSFQFMDTLPSTSTIAPIAIPTLYLWIVDTLALQRGTWAIESGTKLGINLWDGLEIEEAIFFLATNSLIVFGLVAFDHAMAILLTFPQLYPNVPDLPSPAMLVRALLTDTSKYNCERVLGIQQAVGRLQKKSRSFYLASATFSGRLRIDLILLYSFCRVADDLIDNAGTKSEASEWIRKIKGYLDLAYSCEISDVSTYIETNFPEPTHSALRLLPTHILSSGPLYDLLEGFRIDLEFHENNSSEGGRAFPIANGHDLDVYAARVAGTVAELCLELVFHHSKSATTSVQKKVLVHAGGRMGVALQYINIARDIATDVRIGRVYIPTTWLKDEDLTSQDVLDHPESTAMEKIRSRLLDKGFAVYDEARAVMAQLPVEARAPMRVAVESYMEIGRVLRENGYRVKQGRATVPKLRRLRAAWRALSEHS